MADREVARARLVATKISAVVATAQAEGIVGHRRGGAIGAEADKVRKAAGFSSSRAFYVLISLFTRQAEAMEKCRMV